MNTTKAKVIARRNALIWGLPVGILMFLFMRAAAASASDRQSKNSIFFGDISGWPDFVSVGFWPLDLVLALGWAMVLFYLAYRGLSAPHHSVETETWRDVAKYVLGAIVAFASIGGMTSTGMFGWYAGFEGALFTACAAIILVCTSTLITLGVYVVTNKIGSALTQRVIKKARAQEQEPNTGQSANLPCLEHARKLKGYLEADDIPDDPAT